MELRKEEVFRNMSEEKNYTVEDIYALPEGIRAELIDGEMFMMTPPGVRHQDTLMWLGNAIYSHIRAKNGKCRVHVAPLGVYIKEDGRNYLEPDFAPALYDFTDKISSSALMDMQLDLSELKAYLEETL